MLVYSFHVYLWPRKLLRLMDTWIRKFIWSRDILPSKVCTVSWKIMCCHWAAGGLDLKPTRLINESIILKLSWTLVSSKLQWLELFQKRFYSNGQLLFCYFKSSVWPGIKSHIGTVIAISLWIVGTGAGIHLWTTNWLGNL